MYVGRLIRVGVAGALVVAASMPVCAAPNQPSGPQAPIFLKQGWSAAERQWFYTVTQGSQIMPYAWFMALERAADDAPFRNELPRIGYLPNPNRSGNPDSLPVGFVKDIDAADGSEWIGMTCAACHTGQVSFAGRTLQIDGAPTNADMYALIDGIGKALGATAAAKTDAKFKRFAEKVLPAGSTQGEIDKLYADLKAFSSDFDAYVKNSTAKVPWGRSRLDAFGMIFNRATAIDLDIPSNNNEPNAPVSYPFLWDTHWHDVVQWNGSAPNDLVIERLARNVGEVLGVFARTDIKKTLLPPLYFKTTAKRVNQLLIEHQLASLRSPIWPRQWAPIDTGKAAAGRRLYATHCLSCHAITPRSQPLARMKVTMTPLSVVRTDPTMAQNAVSRTARTGMLEGVRMPFLPPIVDPLPAETKTFELVGKIVIGAILAPLSLDDMPADLTAAQSRLAEQLVQKSPDGKSAQESFSLRSRKLDLDKKLFTQAKALLDKQDKQTSALAYKARPLDGIWATAPYLHNGSVPNLWQLLLPADQRDKQFWVGSREFDPNLVGFRTSQSEDASLLDTTLPGNSNAGHDGPAYGTDKMTDDERRQLLEYLKTL
jgi:cytochrome c5